MEAIEKAARLGPDLVVLDLSMPRMGGLSAANHLREARPGIKILIFTTHGYPGLEKLIRSAGCRGFVQKQNAAKDLVRGMRAILSGEEFFTGPEIARVQQAGRLP